jgi:hypothetical protein
VLIKIAYKISTEIKMEDLKKKENGGSMLLLNLLDKGKGGKKGAPAKVLEYNNKDPESTLEQFLLPKERSLKKVETPDSDDVEL